MPRPAPVTIATRSPRSTTPDSFPTGRSGLVAASSRRWPTWRGPIVGRGRDEPPVHFSLLMQSTVEPVEAPAGIGEEDAAPDDSPAGVASKVKLHVVVSAPEFERAIDAAFR